MERWTIEGLARHLPRGSCWPPRDSPTMPGSATAIRATSRPTPVSHGEALALRRAAERVKRHPLGCKSFPGAGGIPRDAWARGVKGLGHVAVDPQHSMHVGTLVTAAPKPIANGLRPTGTAARLCNVAIGRPAPGRHRSDERPCYIKVDRPHWRMIPQHRIYRSGM